MISMSYHTPSPRPPQYPTLSTAKVGLLFRTEVIPFLQHYKVLSVIALRAVTQLQYSSKHKLMGVYPCPDEEREALLCQQFNPVILSHFIG